MTRTPQHQVRTGTSQRRLALVALLVAVTAACGSDATTAGTTAAEPDPTTMPSTTAVIDSATTAVVAESELSLEQATTEIIGIVGAFNSGDLTYLDTLLGADGLWIGISGQQWPGPTAAEKLRPLLEGITSTEILGEGTLVADGWAFPLRERKAGVIDYAIVIGRNADGAPVVTEEWKVPEPLGAPASCAAPAPGAHDLTITVDGTDQIVRVVVPSAASGTVLPTVIDWHATGETAAIQAATSGYDALAEADGFVVAHPEFAAPAYANRDPQTLDASTDADAIAFANALIDALVADWCADPTRIYSTGFSLGSVFTARLACVLSDRLAAVVSVAGIFHSDDCNPARAVPYMAFHGTADPVFPYDASVDARFGGNADFLAQLPLDEFAEFAAAAGCDPTPVDTSMGTEVVRHDFMGCDDGTLRTFYEIIDGGHTWPGSAEAERWAAMGIGTTTDQIDATGVSWDFLQHHHLP
jgi:polyhydroxybutyrate depolymerase